MLTSIMNSTYLAMYIIIILFPSLLQSHCLQLDDHSSGYIHVQSSERPRETRFLHISVIIALPVMELNENESQFSLSCTNFTVEDLKLFNRLRNITALVCAAITLAILLFLICQKAYSSLFQRLYLYLVIGTLLNEIVVGLSIEHQWHYRRQETVCIWLGFFSQFTFVLVFILSYEIIIHLLCIVVDKMNWSVSRWRWIVGSKRYTVTLEIMYIALPVIISIGFAVIPYVKKSYGIAGPWCWVRSLNEHCEPSGLVTQMVFYGLYMLVGIVGMAASVVFAVVYCKLSKESRHLLKKPLYVLIFQFIHIVIIMYNLSVRLYTLISRRHQHYGLWSADAFTLPIGVLIFPFGYLLCFYPVRNVYVKLMECLKLKQRVQGWVQIEMATAPESNRISPPSHTFFEESHPDESDSI